jgi:four helix bundle protein
LLNPRGVNPRAQALQERTQRFFLRVIKFCERLQHPVACGMRGQLLDSAGSADSNYRAACRGRSRAEFISKIAVAAEEADESKGWLTSLVDAGYGDTAEGRALTREADELTAIFTASHKTAKKRQAAAAEAKRRKSAR